MKKTIKIILVAVIVMSVLPPVSIILREESKCTRLYSLFNMLGLLSSICMSGLIMVSLARAKLGYIVVSGILIQAIGMITVGLGLMITRRIQKPNGCAQPTPEAKRWKLLFLEWPQTKTWEALYIAFGAILILAWKILQKKTTESRLLGG